MKRFVLLCVALACVLSAAPSLARDKLAVYWSFTEEQMQHPRMKKALEAFEKKHNVDISFLKKSVRSTDELHEAYLRMLFAKSETPDILQVEITRIPEFSSMGYLVDLSSYMTPEERAKYFESTIDAVTWNGRTWAYPFFVAFGVILYRRDLIDTPPATWDELIEVASRLKSNERYGYVGQMAEYEGFTTNIVEFLWAGGGNVDFSSAKNIFSSSDVQALQLMVDIVNKYKLTPPDQLQYKELEGMQLLSDDKVVFIRHWPEAMLMLEGKGPSAVSRYGIMPLPRMRGKQESFSTLGGWTLAVNPYSKNKQAAVELVKLFTSDAMQKHLILNLGKMPVLKAIYKDKEVMARYPWVKEAYPLILTARPRPRSAYYPEISKILQKEFHLALEGKITPQQAIDRTERKIKAFYRSVGKQRGR